ncbi:MAG: hypothetical protein AAGM38_15895 [Pseudomonadota bacterium]
MADTPFSRENTARRMRAVLKLLGVSKTAFGKLLGYTPQQVRDVINANYGPNHEAVFAVYQITSISADWLVYGLPRGLSELSIEQRAELLELERQAAEELEEYLKSRGRSKPTEERS